jgi:thiosulfate dehydrogenase (quinone) large subunit
VTRTKTYVLTAIAVVLYIVLQAVFADGRFGAPLWNAESIVESSIFTYLFVALIVLAGFAQARALPEQGVSVELRSGSDAPGQLEDPIGWRLLLGNTLFAILWLPIRFFVGQEWLAAGTHKLVDPGYMAGGASLQAYWERAVAIPEQGRPAITYDWFRGFLQFMLDNGWYGWFAPLVAIGQTLVGVGLIVGGLVGIAAFFGTLMNFSFMLAGSASANPVLFGLAVFLILAWKVAGWWGLDRWLLPALGTPWRPGRAFTQDRATPPAGGRAAPV